MNLRRSLAVTGLLLVLASVAGAVVMLGRNQLRFIWLVPVGFVGALISFVGYAWLQYRTVDWERIEQEQRLWESGPLGRRWLKIRTRLLRRSGR